MAEPYGRGMAGGRGDGEARAQWSQWHGGYEVDRSRLVRGWLTVVGGLARPLSRRRISPHAVTLAAVAVAAASVLVAGEGRAQLSIAAVLAAASGVLDGIDGAVAVQTGRATRWGFVVDSVADRLADALLLAAVWRAGAQPAVVVVAGVAVALLEYTRARSAAAGMTDVGIVSVGERPTRVIVVVMTLVTAAVVGHATTVTTVGAAAGLSVSTIGWAQILVVARRALR
jgi:CDP-diacylglycerol--glycerol-3-phosphate 3-phosphatidyltransferase